MKKIEFELWWLWVPVVLFSFFKGLQTKDILIGGVFSSLFVVSFLGVMLRPRKPKVIYSHLNTMLRHLYWIVSGAALVLLWSAFGKAALDLDIPDWLAFILFLGVMALMGLSVAYFLYWSLPYSRKRSGIAAVDAAIERYRKPGEQVGGAWVAPVVIEGKRYYSVTYRQFVNHQAIDENLGFGEDGVVVRNEELMDKIAQGWRLAWNVSNPEQINVRTESYKMLGTLLRLLEKKVFPRWGMWSQAIGPAYVKDMETIRRALEKQVIHAKLGRERYYREAEWGMRHGNTKLREVPYEEVVALNEQDRIFQFLVENLDVLDRGVEAALRLSKVLRTDERLRKKVKELEYVLEALLNTSQRIRDVKAYLARGEVERAYHGMTPEDKQGWLSRLAWVDLVDSWVAQGYTGEALEAKKREYLLEQARREAEQKQQEEAEKARKREERKMRRKAKAVKSTEAGGKNGTL